MTDRPACLELVDGYVAGAMIAHEYAFGLHRKLVAVGADADHTREMLRESAVVALEVPALAQRLRGLEGEWSEQELLDPPAAERTAERLENHVAELAPDFAVLRARHAEIVAELLDLVSRAR
jgi:hypothetical protein